MRSDVRHQLKTDRFAEATNETVNWAVEHRSRLILYSAVVAAIIVLAISFYAVRRSQEQQASIALAAAFDTYSAPVVPPGTPAQPGFQMFNSSKDRAKAANEQFQKVADKYSTQSGKIARYMEGVTFGEMGDYTHAEQDLKQVADHADTDLSNLAKFALASVYRQTNRDNDAINLYQEIAKKPSRSVGKPMADMELANLYSAKQPDKAKVLYQQIAKDNANNSIGQIATEKAAALK